MKFTPAFAGALLAAAASVASAALIAADSHIAAVTVYADRAVVTRTAALDLAAAGPIEVTFEKLPAALLDQSLQVAGRGTAQTTLLDVTARATYVDFAPNERVKSLEDQLRALARDDRALTDRSTVLGQQRDYVLKIQNATTTPPKDAASAPPPTADAWLKLLAFTDEQLNKIATEQQSLDAQREDLQAKRTALEQQLNELRGEGGRSYKTVTVRLAAATAGQFDLTLRYAVPGASWTPAYDARVLSAEHTAQLGYFGLVRQNTGEDWRDVEVTLSTARPSLGGAAPELQPWVVQQTMPIRVQSQQFIRDVGATNSKDLLRYTTNTEVSGVAGEFTKAKAPAPVEVAPQTAAIETQATSATFRIPAKSDIPADNAPHKVAIATVSLKTELNYQATPKLLPAAFLTAEVTNSSDFPLLAGAMNVFLDDTFVAASRLRTVMPGEKFTLALGADEAIAVKRKLNNRFTEDTGLMTKGRRITYDFTLTVQNNKKTAEKVVLLDQVPVSRHEKIVVKILAPDDAKPDADGTLRWTLALAPGEKRELPLKFSIEYPNDLPVTGVE